MAADPANEGYRREVERFLLHAFDPSFVFSAVEWADIEVVPITVEDLQRRVASVPDVRFTPPLVRLRCTHCGSSWDAWVRDDGVLEDERDLWCDQSPACRGARVVLD